METFEGKPVIGEIQDVTRFILVRKIAEGGMGTIYEALQLGAEGFRKTVAIKMIRAEFGDDKQFAEMFIGEAKLVADLVHQNIVQIYQLGKIGKQYYMAMEYIFGVDLATFIERHRELKKPIPVEIATFIISRVCRALRYAHEKRDRNGNLLGIVHRDISPANIMLAYEGEVRVTDFGIAKARNLKHAREGEVLMGKLQYMSPEQAQFKETDGRSDLFSTGVVLYEMLAARQLWQPSNTMKMLHDICYQPVEPIRKYRSDVPEAVSKIIERALQKDRELRYQRAQEMLFDLEYYMYHDRYGPTTSTLEHYLAKIFPDKVTYQPIDKTEERRMPQIFGQKEGKL
ncbi:MAG: serine/threonine protein kinase [Planctomycetota bacterium]|nr:serine/threonine protein kinase [Planctomycetota bacterium]